MAGRGAAGAGAWPYAHLHPLSARRRQDVLRGMGCGVVRQHAGADEVRHHRTDQQSQMFDALWPEVLKWHRVLPDLWRNLWDVTSDHMKLKSDIETFVTARTARPEQPEAMQGIHSEHVLVVCDEAIGHRRTGVRGRPGRHEQRGCDDDPDRQSDTLVRVLLAHAEHRARAVVHAAGGGDRQPAGYEAVHRGDRAALRHGQQRISHPVPG